MNIILINLCWRSHINTYSLILFETNEDIFNIIFTCWKYTSCRTKFATTLLGHLSCEVDPNGYFFTYIFSMKYCKPKKHVPVYSHKTTFFKNGIATTLLRHLSHEEGWNRYLLNCIFVMQTKVTFIDFLPVKLVFEKWALEPITGSWSKYEYKFSYISNRKIKDTFNNFFAYRNNFFFQKICRDHPNKTPVSQSWSNYVLILLYFSMQIEDYFIS